MRIEVEIVQGYFVAESVDFLELELISAEILLEDVAVWQALRKEMNSRS